MGGVDDAERARMIRNFHVAIQMHNDGVAIMRQNLRRRYPDETEREIAIRLRHWLDDRPGAKYGDCVGTPRYIAPGRE
jgi:hypothetical protein